MASCKQTSPKQQERKRKKKKKLVCCSDLMNEKQIMKIGEGSVRESERGHS